jgi:hypothetical protein
MENDMHIFMRDQLIFVGLYGFFLLINFVCNYYSRPKQLYEPYKQFDDINEEQEEFEELSEHFEETDSEIEPDDYTDLDYHQPSNYKAHLRKRKRNSI